MFQKVDALWSNGKTADSGSVYRGSSPCRAAINRANVNSHLRDYREWFFVCHICTVLLWYYSETMLSSILRHVTAGMGNISSCEVIVPYMAFTGVYVGHGEGISVVCGIQ